MKKQRLLKKAIRIISLQRGKPYKKIASEIGITKSVLLYSINKEFDKRHKKICKYAKENLEEMVTPKIECVLNDMSFTEYCKEHDLKYDDFVYERV
jgi:hypothetical protein